MLFIGEILLIIYFIKCALWLISTFFIVRLLLCNHVKMDVKIFNIAWYITKMSILVFVQCFEQVLGLIILDIIIICLIVIITYLWIIDMNETIHK